MDRKPRPLVDLTAKCACGAVHVHVAGTVRAMFMCACEDCQKASGTGHSTVAIVRPADVTITGEARSFERPANSGAIFTRRFCPLCGTPIAGSSSRAPDAVMLPIGLFGADTAWFEPSQVIFGRSHRDWDELAADLPRYTTYRDEEPA